MGWNTTAVILNDALGDIENDPNIGKKLAAGVRQLSLGRSIDVPGVSHCHSIHLVEQHHADHHVPILVGGNGGVALDVTIRWTSSAAELEKDLLKELAHKHGYVLHRKRRTR